MLFRGKKMTEKTKKRLFGPKTLFPPPKEPGRAGLLGQVKNRQSENKIFLAE
jgi:hypothetical protein